MTVVNLDHALRVLGREAAALAEEALQPLGVTTNEYDMLETIDAFMRTPQRLALLSSRASRRIGVGVSIGNTYVLRLQRRGYVRNAVGGSRLLTAKGGELLDECRRTLEPVNRQLQSYFTDTGLELLAEAFLKQQEGIE